MFRFPGFLTVVCLTFTLLYSLPLPAGEPVLTVFVTRHAQRGPRDRWPQEDQKKHTIGEFHNGVYYTPPGEHSITPLGEKQCERLGSYLKAKYGFHGKIYASPSFRTMQTAAATASAIGPELRITPEPRLQERGKRKFPKPGLLCGELEKRFPDRVVHVDYPVLWQMAGEFEKEQVQERMNALVRELLEREKSGQVLLVGHSSSLPALLRALNGLAASRDIVLEPQGRVVNCDLYVFEFDETGKAVRISHDLRNYLDDAWITDNFHGMKNDEDSD